MSRRTSWVLWASVGVLLLGPAAQARQRLRVTPVVELRQEWDSNLNYQEKDGESDVATIFMPSLEISYDGDLGHAKGEVGLRSRNYWQNSELNAVDRYARVEFERRLTPRLSVLSKGVVEYFPDRDAVQDGGGEDLIGDRPDYLRQKYSGGFRYVLDPLSSVTALGAFEGVDYDQGDRGGRFYRRDLTSFRGSLAYVRQLSARDEAGFTLQLANDQFDEVKAEFAGVGEQTNRTVAGILYWARQWTPVWSTRISGGARNVRIDDDGIPGLTLREPGSLDLSPTDSSFGFTGGLELERRTKRTVMTLGYSKDTRPSSGYGSTVDADTVSAGLTLRLTQRLRLDASGFAQRYQSIGDTLAVVDSFFGIEELPAGGFAIRSCPGLEAGDINGRPVCAGITDDVIDARVLGGRVQLGWRMNGHWSTFLRYTFRDQTSEGKRPVAEYTDHRVMMGFRYALPIDLF